MPPEDQSATRQGGGLNVLKEQSDVPECETPNRPYMKAKDEKTKIVYDLRPDCKLWSCKACAERRRRMWVHVARFGGDALLASGRNLSFVTLTSAKNVRTVAGGVWVWRRAWPKLSARWRRAETDLQYLYIPEHREGFHFHVHLITTATLPERWYKDNGVKTGLGYQAKAEPILEAKHCGGYVGKYLAKALAQMRYPKHFRRVNTSRGWPKPPDVDSPYVWAALGSDPSRVIFSVEMYLEAGWVVEHSLEELDWRT